MFDPRKCVYSATFVGLASACSLTGIAQEAIQVPQLPPRDKVQAETAPLPLKVEVPERSEVDLAIRRGKDFLLSSQNKNGSWGAATNTKDLNIYRY